MKKTLLSRFGAVVLILSAFTACNNSPENGFELTGKLDGITEGKVILMSSENRDKSDSAKIENGSFTFKGNVAEPCQYYLQVEGKQGMISFYAENAKMTLTGNVDSLYKAVISGGETQDCANKLAEQAKALQEKYKLNDLYKEMYPTTKDAKPVSKERMEEIQAIMDKVKEETDQLSLNFIKENPKAYYSIILIEQLTYGKSAVEVEKLLNLLDPSLAKYSKLAKMREDVDLKKKTEVGFDTFVANAHNLSYKVETAFAGKLHKDVVYLSLMSNNNICALKSDGTISIIDSKGSKVKDIKSNLKSKPSAVAVDKSDNIYVFGSVTGKKTVEVRGKKREMEGPIGVECLVLDAKGTKIREVKLDSLTTATGARVSENNILVADTRGKNVTVFDAQTGAKKSSIENLRTCCGILDFSIRNNNEILVANLGAFRVESFDFTGKQLVAFGQRGNTINDFHGCCNPVSVAFLSNGGIVTVEKDPTRIKVYSKEGAKKVEGIDELVKGCAYIPMVVDSNDNLYLASKESGIIKCIPAK